MKNIRKSDAFAMREQGLGKFVKRSYSRKPKYYLVEDENALEVYKEYRKSLIK